MGLRFFRRQGLRRHSQSSTDRLGDIPHRYAFFADRMVLCTWLTFLDRQPVKASGVRNMPRGPTIASLAHICGQALLACHSNEISDQSLLDGVVNLWKAHDRSVNAFQSEGHLL